MNHWRSWVAHLADHVIPPVPVRQWVISVPKRLRCFLADRPAAVRALTKIFLAEIERLLCAAAGVTINADALPATHPRLGAVSFLHRFGSALNHHVHLHVCATEGVFVPPVDGARCDTSPAFLPARPINQADLAALTERVRRRVIRWFRRSRLLDAAAAADMLAWENSGFSVDATCPDHAHRPRCAQLFSGSRTPVAVLRPAPVRARAALRDPRLRRPRNQSPLRAAQTQSRQLGRTRSRPHVHAAGSQWRRRTLAV